MRPDWLGEGTGVIRAAGAMTGTSMDGVDLAIIASDGLTIQAFGPSYAQAFSPETRAVLRAGLGTWPGEAAAEAAARQIETAHIAAFAAFRAELQQDQQPEFLGFHGQTLAHEPGGRGTHQAGDGDSLARAIGLPVIWDFRSSDVALGGQGAPLAPFYHWALAQWIGAERPLAFLNLGGVGNLTWVDPKTEAPDAPGALMAFDTGPANAPIDDMMVERGLGTFDADGALARRGRVDEPGVAEFMLDGYFHQMPPKSLDRGSFDYLGEAVGGLGDADAAATLTACAAASVARGLEHFRTEPERILVTGGGRRNAALMAMLSDRTGLPIQPVEEVGLNGDALEAQAFAYLAIRVAKGMTTTAPGTTGVGAPVGGGRRAMP
ncbi:MAG: anhydro-N-acetylmuramic acid kinase [Pseudomonadota bacterium]